LRLKEGASRGGTCGNVTYVTNVMSCGFVVAPVVTGVVTQQCNVTGFVTGVVTRSLQVRGGR
jgi:hypothetical protein